MKRKTTLVVFFVMFVLAVLPAGYAKDTKKKDDKKEVKSAQIDEIKSLPKLAEGCKWEWAYHFPQKAQEGELIVANETSLSDVKYIRADNPEFDYAQWLADARLKYLITQNPGNKKFKQFSVYGDSCDATHAFIFTSEEKKVRKTELSLGEEEEGQSGPSKKKIVARILFSSVLPLAVGYLNPIAGVAMMMASGPLSSVLFKGGGSHSGSPNYERGPVGPQGPSGTLKLGDSSSWAGAYINR